MSWRRWRGRLLRVWIPGGSLLLLGGCGLSDQQMTQVLQSVLTTGLNTLVATFITGLAGNGAAG